MKFLWLWLLLGAAAPHSPQKPGLVILCELGGVAPTQSHIASGYHCVLHDKTGGAFSAGAISVYDDSLGPGP